MKKEYDLLTGEGKLRHWEALVAHKIRSQAEAGGDPDAAVTEAFIDQCFRKDNDFGRFLPALSLTFPVMKTFISDGRKDRDSGKLRRGALIFSGILFFGVQILLVIKEGYKGLIFAGIVNGFMGVVYCIGLRINSRTRKIYQTIAGITGLNFRYSGGGFPGFLYDPVLDGFYNGFRINLSLNHKWTGRWSRGLIGMGQAQTTSRSLLRINMPARISTDVQKEIMGSVKRIHLKGDISFRDDSIHYEVIGPIGSEEMKDDLIRSLKILTEKLFKLI